MDLILEYLNNIFPKPISEICISYEYYLDFNIGNIKIDHGSKIKRCSNRFK